MVILVFNFLIWNTSLQIMIQLMIAGKFFWFKLFFIRFNVAVDDVSGLVCNLKGDLFAVDELLRENSNHAQLAKQFDNVQFVFQLILGFPV